MSRAYVDTTILVDRVLKKGEDSQAARSALRRFASAELPTYAIKELEGGALAYYVWVHNKFVATGSLAKTLAVLARMSMSPQKYRTATALRAIADVAAMRRPVFISAARRRKTTPDQIDADFYRLQIRRIIVKAWRQRRILISPVVLPLKCYQETGPSNDGRVIVLQSRTKLCKVQLECHLASDLKSRPKDLEKMRDAVSSSTKREHERCYKALNDLILNPHEPMTAEACRDLGDAVFAFFAPPGAVILTTNVKDHNLLAGVLGKSVEGP